MATKTLTVTVTAPRDLKEGETFDVVVDMPVAEKKPRGQLAGIAIEDMDDAQLKREIINANSVLYKATDRKAAAETIAKNQARVDAAKAEQAKRQGAKAEVVAPNLDAALGNKTEETIDEGTASEI